MWLVLVFCCDEMSIERNIIKKEIKSMWKDHSQSSNKLQKNSFRDTVFPNEVNAAEFLTSWKKVGTYFKTIENHQNFKREVIDKTRPGFFWLKVSFSN